MFSKLKNLVWHHDTHKKYLLYALIFLVGMVISYGIFNIPASSYRSFISMEDKFEMHRAGEMERRSEINPEVFREGNVTRNCDKNNCDIIQKLNDVQKQLQGGPSWSLFAIGESVGYNSQKITQMYDKLKGPSWPLYAVGQHVAAVQKQLGYSSWTLEALAKHNSNINMSILSAMNNKLGQSSWTLEALAQKIQNKCK